MSTEARLQHDPLERLKSVLEHTSCDHDFLSEYVTEVSGPRHEEEVFRNLAFRAGNMGAAEAHPATSSGFGDLYETLSAEHRRELRRWWHHKLRREAYRHEDLGKRLSWRYFV